MNEILEWNGDFIQTPKVNHFMQTEIYEKVTGILLGLINFHIKIDAPKVIYIPLRKTAHYGCVFENEYNFTQVSGLKAPLAQFLTFDAEYFYFNNGKSKKVCLWTDFESWQKLLDDRK